MPRQILFAFLLAVVLCASAHADLALPKTITGFTLQRSEDLPSVLLRGYGSLGGNYRAFTSANGRQLAVLQITAQDPQQAGLVLAKYRGDLHALGGVMDGKLPVGRGQIPLYTVEGQGAILALCQGKQVWIIAAQDADAIKLALAAMSSGAQSGLDFTGSDVPVYLNKFDRWGFGFWFAHPLLTPPKQEKTYDVREKLNWAKKMDVGLQFYIHTNNSDTADGIIDDGGIRWAIELARQMGIPSFIQSMSDTPVWLANRYPEQMQQKIPQYVGNWYGPNGNNGYGGSPLNQFSWASVEAKNRLLLDMAPMVKRYGAFSNVTGFGEWHGEVGEGPIAMFMDYGPTADARYRTYLREKYKTPEAVLTRWTGGRKLNVTWDDIHLPEPAYFLGWGPQALDLRGEWRTCYEDKLPAEAKETWGALDLNDADWKKVIAPGDDHQIFKERWRTPTIFRRSFDLSAADLTRLKRAGKAYLYLWTLENAIGQPIKAVVNGKPVGEKRINDYFAWASFDVTDTLQVGKNLLAFRLPWGEISYRVYLSPDAPKCYPDLGPELDAQWVDYRDFIAWMREDSLRRSIETIRREEPNKPIKIYAPHAVGDIMKVLAEDYGCYFHDTGGMSGNWNDELPSLMRGAGKPMSIEPGNAAGDLLALKSMFGHWSTEGLAAVDYFADITDILWRPDQKEWFEARQPLVHMIGKYHSPFSKVAVLRGYRSDRLVSFPWSQNDTPLLWNTRKHGVGTLYRVPYPRDEVTEMDFMRDTVGKYQVIIDDATLVMDDALIAKIEQWVKDGGIFITQGQTGRHSPEAPDTWPINRLTGYKVVGNNDNWRVTTIPGQPIFTDPAWTQKDARNTPLVGGAGCLLEKVAPECQDILMWADNKSIAMGVRPLGKGKVITMGTPMPGVASGWNELLTWCGTPPVPPASAPGCRVMSFVSNNGLYDIYSAWAQGVKEPGAVALTLPGTRATVQDVLAGKPITGTPGTGQVVFNNISVEPLETYVYRAPRNQIAEAPLEWFTLQRAWWGGTRTPAPAPEAPRPNNTLNLSADWAFSPIPAGVTDTASLGAPALDDSKWDRQDLGIWLSDKYPDVHRGVYRKRFTIPQSWAGSERLWLWMRDSWPAFLVSPYKAQAYLDGKKVWECTGWRYGTCCQDATQLLTPGEHQLTLVTESDFPTGGIPANLWIERVQQPKLRQSLAGTWGAVQLPGKVDKLPAFTTSRTFTPDPAGKGKQAVLYMELTTNNIFSIVLNGRWISRNQAGQHPMFNITPYLRWGQPNTLELGPQYPQNGADVTTVEIRYYDKDQL